MNLHFCRTARLLGGWAFLLSGMAACLGQIVISEIHYDPDVKTDPAEFIELHNAGPDPVLLDGWSLSDGIEYRFSNGVSLPPGGFLVVAQNPPTLQEKYGAAALGPWIGALDNDGERVVLRDAAGAIVDEVSYQLGFPWPTVGDPPGYSIELVHPALDNNLGGSWRAAVAGNPVQQSRTLLPTNAVWHYFKGLSEASVPADEWRRPEFDDTSWASGRMPIGYDPAVPMETELGDMRYNYTTVYFRSTFVVDDVAEISELTLDALYDDGFKVWINTTNALDANMAAGDVPYTATSGPFREDASYNTLVIGSPGRFLRPGTNVIAILGANVNLTNSSDFYLDVRLAATIGPSQRGPTPGRLNATSATNLPPQIRQLEHRPRQPAAGEVVRVTAKITDPDGVAGASVLYQAVDPGDYIELTDAAYTNQWTELAMNDSGQSGDEFAGDSLFTALVPAPVQVHRRLVRYRLRTLDAGGRSLTVPYADDPQPNFAYFVYDGVPAWQGAVRPGVTPVLSFDTNVMRRLPVIHLLAKRSMVEEATWFSRYGGDLYRWAGTLVYDGEVYDHVRYRARGGVWRYSMVKNMWKFDFNTGHDFQMTDDSGRRYGTRWTKLNLGACIQQGDYLHRGEQGLFESVGFRLFNLAGIESPHTTFVQLRIIDDAVEADPATQYEGDFWGLYLALEQEDGRFLDEHDLPDSNLYKMEGGSGELNNLGPNGPADKTDLNAFLTYTSTTPSDDWWRANLDLPRYYNYRAIVEAIHHYDIDQGAGKNYFYFTNSITGRWSVHSWDLDLTWANNMYGGGDEPFRSRVLPRAAFGVEYRNRVRELRDLLFNTDQAYRLIDEHAARLRDPGGSPTFLDADRCMWDWNPKMASGTYSQNLSKAGQGRFYQWTQEPTVSKDFEGGVQLMKNYVVSRGTLLDNLARDAAIPSQPTVAYTGPTNYPMNRLTFRASPYAGTNGFAALKWRIAEVTDPAAPAFDPLAPVHYEIEADWESPETTTGDLEVQVPAGITRVGHAYRVRVRMGDITGRWSHWSAPVQFVVSEPDQSSALLDHLRLTEILYDPPAGSEFEFVELLNTSTNLTLDLAGAEFTRGVGLVFPDGQTIDPGRHLVVARTTNVAAFRAHYGLAPDVPVIGGFSGSLADEGEGLTLKTGRAGTAIVDFEYGGRGWPLAAEGAGHSLVVLDRALRGQATGALDYPGNWRASAYQGGSPGRPDPSPPASTVVLNEIAAHTDYTNPLRPEYDSNDWIELLNLAPAALDLAGWFLSDDPADPRKWALPHLILPAGARLTLDEVSGFHSPTNVGFGLDKAGEQVLLSYLPGTAEDRVADGVAFKGQENERSWSRYPDGAGFWYPSDRSSNAVNTLPAVSLVINEIQYRPPDQAGAIDNALDEYVEIHNPSANAIALSSTNGAWRLDGGIEFSFPAGTTVPPGGCLLVVNFDPAIGTNLAWFRTVYGLSDAAAPILGPYSGRLGNRSDRVALERPQYPDLPGEPYSWVIVDEVIYGNQEPWPAAADGAGLALQRLLPSESGLDPANWAAAEPTPGRSIGDPDRDGDGMPNAWETDHALNPDHPDDAGEDADGDRLTNLEEYLAGTDPRDPASALRLESARGDSASVRLQFQAQAGRGYSVQYRAQVAEGTWLKLRDVEAESTAHWLEIVDDSAPETAERYYRLVTPCVP